MIAIPSPLCTVARPNVPRSALVCGTVRSNTSPDVRISKRAHLVPTVLARRNHTLTVLLCCCPTTACPPLVLLKSDSEEFRIVSCPSTVRVCPSSEASSVSNPNCRVVQIPPAVFVNAVSKRSRHHGTLFERRAAQQRGWTDLAVAPC
jgi:hypothetical protein